MRYNNLLFLFFLILITSCKSNVKSQWDCPAAPGKFCNTITHADQTSEEVLNQPKIIQESFFNSLFKSKPKEFLPINNSLANNIFPQRSNEEVAKLWFTPFIDLDGNLHAEKVIYVIKQDNKWMMNNAK